MKIAVIQSILNEHALLPVTLRAYDYNGKLPEKQMQAAAQEMEKNIQMIISAAKQGADLIVTTEAINHCLFFDIGEPPYQKQIHPEILRLCAIARNYQCYIAAGLHTSEGGVPHNSAVLFNPSGQIESVYHKIHLPAGEEKEVVPGNSYEVISLPLGNLGMLVCWDMQFPEAARSLALLGADLIVCPTWGWEDIYGLCRAYENSVYIAAAMAIPTNTEWWEEHMSQSCIVDPMGKKVAQAVTGQREIIMADVDLHREPEPQYGSGELTGHFSMRYTRLSQRRPDTYSILLQQRAPLFDRYEGA